MSDESDYLDWVRMRGQLVTELGTVSELIRDGAFLSANAALGRCMARLRSDVKRHTFIIVADTAAGAATQFAAQFRASYGDKGGVGEMKMLLKDGTLVTIKLNGSEKRKEALERREAARAKREQKAAKKSGIR